MRSEEGAQLVEDAHGDAAFGHAGNAGFGTVTPQQPAGVGGLAEGGVEPHFVDHEQVAAFASEFLTTQLEHRMVGVAGFGSKADGGEVGVASNNVRQDVGVAGECDAAGFAAGALFEFGVCGGGGAEVGYGSSHDDGIDGVGVEERGEGVVEVEGTGDGFYVHAGGKVGEVVSTKEESDVGAALGAAGGEGSALLAGGVVAQVADWVEGFAGTAGSHDDVASGEVAGHRGCRYRPGGGQLLFFEEGEGHVGNLVRFGQAPGAGVGARQPTHCWLHHRVAMLAEGGDIALD